MPSLLQFIMVFYYPGFTNGRFTFSETNVGRVLLQIWDLMIPLYCLFVKQILVDHNAKM
jgi:hypothetical protein